MNKQKQANRIKPLGTIESYKDKHFESLDEVNSYPGERYQRLFNAINDATPNPIQTQMDDIIKIIKEDFMTYSTPTPVLQSIEGKEFGEWQICPKCNGQGTVSKPPYLAGDITEWSSTEVSFQCDVCNGNKIITKPIFPATLPAKDKTNEAKNKSND